MPRDDRDAPVRQPHEAVLGAPGRSDVAPLQEPVDDPLRPRRLILGLFASALMALSVFFTGAVFGFAGGGHSPLLRSSYGGRELILVLVGLGAAWFILNPTRPDSRVAQSAMLAAGIIAVAVGTTLFFGALAVQPHGIVVITWPGPQAWMLLVSAVLFLYLRWQHTLWPESRWRAELTAHTSRRRR